MYADPRWTQRAFRAQVKLFHASMRDGLSSSSGCGAPILPPMKWCRAIVAYIVFVDALRSDAANCSAYPLSGKCAEGDFAVPWPVGWPAAVP